MTSSFDGAQAQTAATADARNYRRLIADSLATSMKTLPAGTFQAGPLRVSQAPQPGDYAVCLRSEARGRTSYFAAFITAGAVETIRRAVGIDRCWLETDYAALPPPTPAKASTRVGGAAQPGQPGRKPFRKQ